MIHGNPAHPQQETQTHAILEAAAELVFKPSYRCEKLEKDFVVA